MVGIVIPTYNRASWIGPCIKAIQAQTYTQFQCVIVDDASRDDSVSVITQHIQDDQRFDLIKLSQRKGPSYARNIGVKKVSQSEWIAFCDSDDRWYPQKLEKQMAALNVTKGKVCHTEEKWLRNGKLWNPKKKHQKPRGRIFSACLPLCCVSPSAIVLHRDVWQQVGGFDEDMLVCEDYDLWLRIFSRYEAVLIAEPLVEKNGGHSDQLSRQLVGMDRFRLYALLKAKRDLVDYLGPTEITLLNNWIQARARVLALGYEKHQGKRAATVFKKIQIGDYTVSSTLSILRAMIRAVLNHPEYSINLSKPLIYTDNQTC